MKYRADIDGLRTIAVLPVIIYHAGLGLPGGFVGVDVFFVISGYLITYLLVAEIDADRFSILKFYERRARRIFPALFTMLLATALAASVTMMPFDFRDFGKSLVATTLFAANIWFFREEGYFTEAAELEPLLHTWSLGVEEQYYIIFPLLLFAASRVLGRRGAFVLISIVGLCSFLASVIATSSAPEAAFYLPQLRAWELLIGSLLAIAVVRRWWGPLPWMPGWGKHVLSLAGLAAILWPILAYNTETLFPGITALLPCLGAFLLISVGSDGRSVGTRLLSLSPMTFVGKLSYSLYLWHWPVISLFFYQRGDLSRSDGILCLVISFILAYLSWRFVEQPLRDRSRVGTRTIAAGSVFAMFLSIGIGVAIWQLDGMPNRVDPDLLAMANSKNFAHDRRDCHFVNPSRASKGDVCVRGAAKVEPSFVLVGDSHADAISPAIFAAANDLNLAGYQYTDAGFAPFPGVWRLGREGTDDVDAFIEFLKNRPTIKTLIVARYWQLQLTGYTYRHQGGIWVDDEYDGSGAEYNKSAVEHGMARLARLFPDRKIILLDDVPTGSALHIRDQLRRMKAGRSAEFGLPEEDYKAQRTQYEDILKGIAADLPNVIYQPLFGVLCNDRLCPLFDGETLLYRDGDHLSWKGALRLTPNARDLLQYQ
ncbi:acyltransferase family protein [Shimia aestuarii]|uniref:Peptidoglycan/LPS O-acetylase OafA/YrhL, contains acyltransferase and SGNH-hydrolase domains n=1 Tax=Shimia aestuarii TaxID=254406 RepID=A0A1I4NNA1_9RHOB|nr:acyltransferase family protein [Shimia aestuarii]SFM16787.1 Peptidoglycan/LPS O-acetylase OafA/YrhL, contains acyltransferase and SGNH-hydrolase domains [Shimia aestuarii]